ncbi:hypothetical protein ACEQ8H_003911 [Pleosporales sp. CAS-2024a]
MDSNQTASRAAKRFLDARVRSDWAYPDVPPAWSASDEEVRDARDFCERFYAASESGDDAPPGHDGHDGPYKFDTPDSVGHAVAQTRQARSQARRARLDDEMQHNPGLRLWVERRDAWTGAASVRKYASRRRAPAHAAPPDTTAPDAVDLLPVAPRLLPDNPIRTDITPRAYPDIFQKIVVSSRTPSVPINLADMTRALVQGWKDSDEWPPRAALRDPLVGKKRPVTAASAHPHHAAFINRHPHLEKGVDSVKRILHLNPTHHAAADKAG